MKKFLKNEFNNEINKCYPALCDKVPGSIFYLYNEDLLRQYKLQRFLGGKKIIVNIDKSKVMFQVDRIKEVLWIDNTVWNEIYKDLNDDDKQVEIMQSLVGTELANLLPGCCTLEISQKWERLKFKLKK